MNKNILALSTLALSLSVAQVPLAYADHMKCFSGDRMEKLADKLDLTADQKTKIKTIRTQAIKDMKPKIDDLYTTRQKINELFKSNPVNESTLDDLIGQEKETLGSILKIRLMERRDIANVLTDQQRTKLADMIKTWEEKHQHDTDD